MALIGREGVPPPIGATLADVIRRMPPGAEPLLHHVFDTGEPFAFDDYALRATDGTVRHLNATLMPVAGAERPTVVVSILDVTERTEARAGVAASAEMVERLATRVAAGLGTLARLVGAASAKDGVDGVIATMAEGIHQVFGVDVAVATLNEADGVYEVRATTDDRRHAGVGTWHARELIEGFLDDRFERSANVFFVPHDDEQPLWTDAGTGPNATTLDGAMAGCWHPRDAALVRIRTSSQRDLGVLVVTAGSDPVPFTPWQFQMLGMYAEVGANVAETLLLAKEIAASRSERELNALRRELMDELLLHRHLVEIGGRLGVSHAAAAPTEVFPLLARRLQEVLPITSLTINRVDDLTRTFRPIYHSELGKVAEAMLRFEAPIGAGASGKAALDGRWVIANAGEDQPAIDVPGTPDEDEHLMAVPVLIDEQVRAVLTLRRSWRAAPFTPADARRTELFAQHVTATLLLVELAEAGEELASSRLVLAEQVKQLEALDSIKDEFIANVSHELRTPLTAVLGNLATLNRPIAIPEDIRAELMVAAERQARRLGELLENLLAASRLVGEDPAIVAQEIDVRSFLQEIAAALRARGPGRSVSLRVKGGPVVISDPTLLYRVLFNLGDNALKYSDGAVSIGARVSGANVRIDVRDRGVGIAADDLPGVFDRFRQLDGASTRRVGGVGLGLYLSSRLASALGGRIDVVSELAAGSTFTLVLPLQQQMRLLDDAGRTASGG
jgi:signal transduction histidine kinase